VIASKSSDGHGQPEQRICCLAGRQEWHKPKRGVRCASVEHGHLPVTTVRELVKARQMCWLPGTRKAARFVNADQRNPGKSCGSGPAQYFREATGIRRHIGDRRRQID
jgi:hypothetical protein